MEHLLLNFGFKSLYPINTAFFFQSLLLIFFAFFIVRDLVKKHKFNEKLFLFVSLLCLISVLGFSSLSEEFLHSGYYFIVKKILFLILSILVFFFVFKFKLDEKKEQLKNVKNLDKGDK